MKWKKTTAAMLTVVILLTACLIPAYALAYGEEWQPSSAVYPTRFDDVPANHWAYEYIMRVIAKGWFSGYTDGTFRPNGKITRAEAMKVFVQFLGMEVKSVTSTSFDDVDVNKWYAPYIEAGKDLLPVHAVPGGQTSFQPDVPITREDVMYALVVALGFDSDVKWMDASVLDVLDKFQDQESITPTLQPYVAWAINYGLVSGYGNSTIRGQDPLTRAEFAKLIYFSSLTGPCPDRDPVLQSVTITSPKYARKDMKVGEGFAITAEALYTDGTTKDYEIFDAYDADRNGVIEISGSWVTATQPGNCVIKFKDENLRYQSIVVVVSNEPAAVTLSFDDFTDTAYEPYITLSGTVKDSEGGTVTLKCNDSPVLVENNGTFSHVLQLNVGQNEFEFAASNSAGATFTGSIVITRKEVSINIDRYPTYTFDECVTFSGKVSGAENGTVSLTCNGTNISVNQDGSFSLRGDLAIGQNSFEFVAANEAGVSASKTITVRRINK